MHLGHNARAIGDHSAAFAAFSAAALLNRGQPQAEIELAVEEFRLGRTSLAVDRLKGILTRHPTSTQALEALASIWPDAREIQIGGVLSSWPPAPRILNLPLRAQAVPPHQQGK